MKGQELLGQGVFEMSKDKKKKHVEEVQEESDCVKKRQRRR
jgi:predicted nucleotidyltransferase